MVTLLLDSTRLEIALSAMEKTLAFHRENVRIERRAITTVQLTDDAWTWLRGVAKPGTYIPSTVAMGRWQSAGGVDFALIRRRRPGVVIDLDGHPDFQRVILTTRHGVELVKALRLDGTSTQTDVVDIVAPDASAPTSPPAPEVT